MKRRLPRFRPGLDGQTFNSALRGRCLVVRTGYTLTGPIVTCIALDAPAVPRREGGVIPGNAFWIEGWDACRPFMETR